jgi:hypothetical protein
VVVLSADIGGIVDQWEVVVLSADIGGIVDHHLNFLFIKQYNCTNLWLDFRMSLVQILVSLF